MVKSMKPLKLSTKLRNGESRGILRTLTNICDPSFFSIIVKSCSKDSQKVPIAVLNTVLNTLLNSKTAHIPGPKLGAPQLFQYYSQSLSIIPIIKKHIQYLWKCKYKQKTNSKIVYPVDVCANYFTEWYCFQLLTGLKNSSYSFLKSKILENSDYLTETPFDC